ncbi:MAG: hypothetical protein OXC61_03965 [Flavobacteriaceae bacterium]|nr:hypothetical protein [Flavobacteriaceae bacterium]
MIISTSHVAYNQYLELDELGSRVMEPNYLRVQFINQLAANADTYGNLNIWGEFINAKTSFKSGTHLSFHMFSSQTIVYRNWPFEDHFSTISKILDPTGGTLKASILFTHPITSIKSSKINLGSRFGTSWMTTNITEESFLSHHLHLGISIQQKIKERKLKDAIYLVLYPHYVINFINEEDTMAHLWPEYHSVLERYYREDDHKPTFEEIMDIHQYSDYSIQGLGLESNFIFGKNFRWSISIHHLMRLPDSILNFPSGHSNTHGVNARLRDPLLGRIGVAYKF